MGPSAIRCSEHQPEGTSAAAYRVSAAHPSRRADRFAVYRNSAGHWETPYGAVSQGDAKKPIRIIRLAEGNIAVETVSQRDLSRKITLQLSADRDPGRHIQPQVDTGQRCWFGGGCGTFLCFWSGGSPAAEDAQKKDHQDRRNCGDTNNGCGGKTARSRVT